MKLEYVRPYKSPSICQCQGWTQDLELGGSAKGRGYERGGSTPPPAPVGERCKLQKLCKFRVMKLQNNKEFHNVSATKLIFFSHPPFKHSLVPRPTSQLRMDYITTTRVAVM